jgi:hypothetical protein
MQGKGLLLKGRSSIVNSHGEHVHVNESFCYVVCERCWTSVLLRAAF